MWITAEIKQQVIEIWESCGMNKVNDVLLVSYIIKAGTEPNKVLPHLFIIYILLVL